MCNYKRKRKRISHSVKLWTTIVLTLLSDQITKHYAFIDYEFKESTPLIDGLVWITPRLNKGAAFSFLANVENSNILFVIIAIAFIPILLWMSYGKYRGAPALSFGLLIGGAIGNAIDRLMEGQGVRDFIDLKWWPVFNIADAGIAIGCITLIIWSVFFAKYRSDHITN